MQSVRGWGHTMNSVEVEVLSDVLGHLITLLRDKKLITQDEALGLLQKALNISDSQIKRLMEESKK